MRGFTGNGDGVRNHVVHLFRGTIEELDRLDDVPLPKEEKQQRNNNNEGGSDLLETSISILPFSTIQERGFFAVNEGEKILSLRIDGTKSTSFNFNESEADEFLPPKNTQFEVGDIEYEMSQKEYEQIVQDIIDKEIYRGEGSSFVTPRRATAQVKSYSPEVAMCVFRRFLEQEFGAYWTFCFHDGKGNCLVGASPERQATVQGDEVLMNPISGTFRKNANESVEKMQTDFSEFLKDQKEIDELFMVTDEELKMMCRICPDGGTIAFNN